MIESLSLNDELSQATTNPFTRYRRMLKLTTSITAVMKGASWRAKRRQSLIGPWVLSHHRFH